MCVALSLRHVRKVYRAGVPGCSAAVHVLTDASIDVAAGEVVALSGAPASGKTTLLLIAAGRLRADAGSVSWFGSPAAPGLHPPGIALVPAHASYYSFLTVREALEYYTVMRDVALARPSAVHDTLERVGLAELAQGRVSRLSPFELRRLALAQALITAPRLLLLDETLSAGDSCGDLAATIAELARDGVTVLAAARTSRGVERIATREVVLSSGCLRSALCSARDPSILELRVTSPSLAVARLAARLEGVQVSNGMVQVPLRELSPEAVMALCAALNIDVLGSSVVRAGVATRSRERRASARVAEGRA